MLKFGSGMTPANNSSAFLSQSDVASLVEDYSHVWRMLGKDEFDSVNITIDFIHRAAKEVQKKGLLYEPSRIGDRLLHDAASNFNVKAFLDVRRADGVRDDDIQSWWNQPPIERMLQEHIYEHRLLSTFTSALELGNTEAQAGDYVRRVEPMFGEPTLGDDENRPLPIELMDPVAVFAFESRLLQSAPADKPTDGSTYNAIVRRGCKAGLMR